MVGGQANSTGREDNGGRTSSAGGLLERVEMGGTKSLACTGGGRGDLNRGSVAAAAARAALEDEVGFARLVAHKGGCSAGGREWRELLVCVEDRVCV